MVFLSGNPHPNRSKDSVVALLGAFGDGIASLEDVEEERIRLEQENEEKNRVVARQHSDEKQRMQAQFVAEWQTESASLLQHVEEERGELNRRHEQSRADDYRRIQEEEAEMSRRMVEFQAECERNINESRKECARMTQEKVEMAKQMEEYRQDLAVKMSEEKAVMRQRADTLVNENEHLKIVHEEEEEEKRVMTRKMEEAQLDWECRMEEEHAEMDLKMAEARRECERMAEDKAQMTREMLDFRLDYDRKVQEQKSEMQKKTVESRKEFARLAQDKAEMTKEMAKYRSECMVRMQDEKAQMQKKMEQEREAMMADVVSEKDAMRSHMLEFRRECESITQKQKSDHAKTMADSQSEHDRMEQEKLDMIATSERIRVETEMKMKEEKEAMIAKARMETEAQLSKERAVTDSIRHAMLSVPPLQTAMEFGDLNLLETELGKWSIDAAGKVSLPDRFGECKGVVEAVIKLGRERMITWRGVEHTLKDVLREADKVKSNASALAELAQRLFRALKEAQLTKMDVRRSDPKALDKIAELLLKWTEVAMMNSNQVQRAIIRKVVNWPKLGAFDFVDLDVCMRLVDRSEVDSQLFLTRALVVAQDEEHSPKELQPLLSHIETMLFFLKYTKSEDLALCHAEFRKQAPRLDRCVAEYLQAAERAYPPGAEIVQMSSSANLEQAGEVDAILQAMRHCPNGPAGDGLGAFREIFFQWAVVMRKKFDLLVLPHHTQVVTLLAFKRFLEASVEQKSGRSVILNAGAIVGSQTSPRALVAQVGTGEGKSMIVASLAIFVAVVLRKKAHVVVDDETLLERDFSKFRTLFDMFEVPESAAPGARRRPLKSVLCVPEEHLQAEDSGYAARIDPEADICYCEAKHVQSFYAQIARETRNFDAYEDRVLILDEVDALVIDEEPNEAFVYPNEELSEVATQVAATLARGEAPERITSQRNPNHPANARVIREVSREWARAKQLVAGEDFVYAKEAGKYCALQGGRANAKAWSLALECRNFQDGLGRDIIFKERMFVMCRPRVFKKYHRILGLSGSIGSDAERAFLKDTYGAQFFEVPPFLKTCRGSPFHEAVPAQIGGKRRAVHVEATPEAQLSRLGEVALEARERVPVLVIAKDRTHADQVVQVLRQAARSRGLGGASDDVVRSLSRTLYEADPEQWKENLNRATLPLGDHSSGTKTWRITVTDRRGGRGTDYRVDDPEVDNHGGLLLLPMIIPTSQRDWIQYLGRTARQDRKGHYTAVICQKDYEEMSKKYQQPLSTSQEGLEVIQTILSWGDREVAERIRASAALYNTGMRVNELSENIFGRNFHLLEQPAARELIVDTCQRFRWMSVKEVNESFARIQGFQPMSVSSEARDMGRPAEPPSPAPSAGRSMVLGGAPGAGQVTRSIPKLVMFCLDWSASMLSNDTGTKLTRFGMCAESVKGILRDQVGPEDIVSIVGFGATVETPIPPMPKGDGRNIEARLAGMRPQMQGGTCFYDAVAMCLQVLARPGIVAPDAPKWLICLTDGDDMGSRHGNTRGEMTTSMFSQSVIPKLNMAMITVTPLKPENSRIISSWCDNVNSKGGMGRLMAESSAVNIASAFEVVAEALAADVGGATEC